MKAARAISLSLAALASVVIAAPAPASSGDDLRLAPTAHARFPERSFALTLPSGRSLDPSQIRVTENGRAVSRPTVTAAQATRGQFGFALVIDASASMRGRAIEGAMAAARAFARHRHPEQKLGIVTFNREALTALPPTSDGPAIESALASAPTLGNGTRVYEAVNRALDLLEQAKVSAGSIVVLSDGADTGSTTSAAEVAAAAKAAGVRIFTVGLRSRSFDGAVLRDLARAAGGRSAEARTTKGLARIYNGLGSVLANEYLVRYRSLARPDANVRVEVRVEGQSGTAHSEYVTPPLASGDSEPTAVRRTFWASTAAMVGVSILCALVIALAIVALLALRPRGNGLRQRMQDFVSSAPDESEEESGRRTLTGKVFTAAERSLEQTSWWGNFEEELEIARIRIPAVQLVLCVFIGTLLALWLLAQVTGSGLLALPGLGVPLVVRSVLKRLLERQRRLFSDQLADNLLVIASAMRAGHSFAGALSVAAEDAPEPARSEFRRVIADEKLGVPLEEGLEVVARRMKSRDLEQVVLVAGLHRETGGDSAEVLELVAETVRERGELRRTVDTLTAQGRLSRWVVTSIPIALMFFITSINPDYMYPLYNTGVGRTMLVLAAFTLTVGSFVIKRIVNIKI